MPIHSYNCNQCRNVQKCFGLGDKTNSILHRLGHGNHAYGISTHCYELLGSLYNMKVKGLHCSGCVITH